VAVIDVPAPFRIAVRGYDRSRVDAMIRAEQAELQRLNERIAMLEHHLTAVRSAALRVDDPNRTQSIRTAADLLIDAWNDARQLLNAEDATADLQRKHAASTAASHLADMNAWAEQQEGRARARVAAMIAEAHEEAERLRLHAIDFMENVEPMAEQVLADANAMSAERAATAENELHLRREAMDADLTQRQTAADYDLQAAERLHAQVQQEAIRYTAQAHRMRDDSLAQARGLADDLTSAVADEIGALEAESDRGLAELAEHMATLSTELTLARKTMATRPGRAPRRAKAEPTVAATAPQAAPVPEPQATAATVTPAPKAKAAPRKAAEPAQPRVRTTTPAAASTAKRAATQPVQPTIESVTEEADKAMPPAARPLPPTETVRVVTVAANRLPVVRL
jgi:hypothetical protein